MSSRKLIRGGLGIRLIEGRWVGEVFYVGVGLLLRYEVGEVYMQRRNDLL